MELKRAHKGKVLSNQLKKCPLKATLLDAGKDALLEVIGRKGLKPFRRGEGSSKTIAQFWGISG
jgi:hypothetical protein